jgi:formate hydrogenlyase subunit 3/multisubunit Na+/H+ antiporter MnhD subunit
MLYKRLHLVATLFLIIFSLCLAVPIWVSTLAGTDGLQFNMRSVFGVWEQRLDFLCAIFVITIGIISLLHTIKEFRNKGGGS